MTTAVLACIVALAFGAIAWRDFRFALALFFGLLPTYLLRFSVGPIPSTLLELLVLALCIVFFIHHRGTTFLFSLSSFHSRWRTPVLLGLAAACFAAAYAPDIFAAVGILKAYYIEPVLVLLMLRSTFIERHDWKRAATALLASGLVVAVVAVVQHLTGIGIPAPWDVERRATSVFDFSNAVGLFLAPIIAGACAILPSVPTRRTQSVLAVSTLLMLAGIVASKTEAAFIAIPAALLLALLFSRAKVSIKIPVVTIAVLVGIAAFTVSGTVREKILLHDVSGQARVTMWHETVKMLREHPLLGAGLSGFPSAIAPYHDATYFEIFQYPHNVLLNIWVELGLLGVVTAIFLAVQILQATWRYRDDPRALAAFAAVATMVIHGLVDVPFFKNDLAILTASVIAFLIYRDNQKTA